MRSNKSQDSINHLDQEIKNLTHIQLQIEQLCALYDDAEAISIQRLSQYHLHFD